MDEKEASTNSHTQMTRSHAMANWQWTHGSSTSPQSFFVGGQVNSSVSYEITPIQKVIEEETAHYKWGFRYNIIDGFLQYSDQGNTGARVMIEYLGFDYDFYIVENASYMKMSFDIGNITDIEPWWGEPPISLENLSLSLHDFRESSGGCSFFVCLSSRLLMHLNQSILHHKPEK